MILLRKIKLCQKITNSCPLGWSDFVEKNKVVPNCYYRTPILRFNFEMLLLNSDGSSENVDYYLEHSFEFLFFFSLLFLAQNVVFDFFKKLKMKKNSNFFCQNQFAHFLGGPNKKCKTNLFEFSLWRLFFKEFI